MSQNIIKVQILQSSTKIYNITEDDALYLGSIYSNKYETLCDVDSIEVKGRFTKAYWSLILETVFPQRTIEIQD